MKRQENRADPPAPSAKAFTSGLHTSSQRRVTRWVETKQRTEMPSDFSMNDSLTTRRLHGWTLLLLLALGFGTARAQSLLNLDFAANPAAKAPTPNIWLWAMAMSSFSKKKDATWYFLQWVTGPEHDLFGAQKMDLVNPARKSVWADGAFRDKLSGKYQGYVEMFDVSAPGASIPPPRPKTLWAPWPRSRTTSRAHSGSSPRRCARWRRRR